MTEDEAGTKWCCGPLQVLHAMFVNAFMASGMKPSEVRGEEFPHGGMCVGSACMAWRWAWVPTKEKPDLLEESSTRGYCGIGGKPAEQP